jgi:vacuolar-type H+-ATPase subunit E/Vma4
MDEPGPGALIGAIEERAEEERARLAAEAQVRAEEIRAAAEAESQRIRAEGLALLETELAAERLRLLGEARMRARGESLVVRRALLAEAFERAGREIRRMREGTMAETVVALAALAEEAQAAVGDPCTVEGSAEDWRVTAISADGKRVAENSLDGRLLRAQAAAESAVARILFGT